MILGSVVKIKNISDCRPPFEETGGRCLYFSPLFENNWDEARTFCAEIGGNLAIIDNAETFLDVVDHIIDRGWYNKDPFDWWNGWCCIVYVSTGSAARSFWLAGTDRVVDGTWTWTNGRGIELGAPFWAVKGTTNGTYVTVRKFKTLQIFLIFIFL